MKPIEFSGQTSQCTVADLTFEDTFLLEGCSGLYAVLAIDKQQKLTRYRRVASLSGNSITFPAPDSEFSQYVSHNTPCLRVSWQLTRASE